MVTWLCTLGHCFGDGLSAAVIIPSGYSALIIESAPVVHKQRILLPGCKQFRFYVLVFLISLDAFVSCSYMFLSESGFIISSVI